MTGKRLYTVWLLGLALFISSCGNDAPPDAVITPVEGDKTTEISGGGGFTLVDGAIHFKVTVSSEDTTPVSNATVSIFGTSPSIADATAGFVGSISGGAFLNPANPNQMSLLTSAQGIVTVFYQYTVPTCSLINPTDINVSANINASIGGSTGEWKNDITIKCS